MTLMSGSYSFLFRDSAGERERLEKAIVYALREAQIQNKVALKKYTGGGVSHRLQKTMPKNTDRQHRVYNSIVHRRGNFPLRLCVQRRKNRVLFKPKT